MLLAVKVGAVARPFAFVTTCAVVCPPANVPLAPLDGAVNVTVTPAMGWLPLSRTVAWNAVVKAVPITALCSVPAVAAIEAGGADRFVRLNVAEVAPLTLAVTV